MSGILRVRWTITPLDFPQPWLTCSRCDDLKPFRCSGKFRLNANGRRLDAWLIYRCSACDATWNRPLFERRRLNAIDPQLLDGLQANDPDWVGRFGRDAAGLRHHASRVDMPADITVRKEILAEVTPFRRLEILFSVVGTTSLRTDRLLAAQLGFSRRRIAALRQGGRLVIVPGGDKAMARSVREGSRAQLDLDAESMMAVVFAATENP